MFGKRYLIKTLNEDFEKFKFFLILYKKHIVHIFQNRNHISECKLKIRKTGK